MSEKDTQGTPSQKKIDYYKTDTSRIIELADFGKLEEIEERIAQQLYWYPYPDQKKNWDARTSVRELLRPPKFHGRLEDMLLIPMEDPLTMLQTVTERGKKFQSGQGLMKRKINESETRNRSNELKVYGFTFIANATSSGRGNIGHVQAELYYRNAPNRNKIHSGRAQGATGIYRAFTMLEVGAETLHLNEMSRLLSAVALAQNMSDMISTPTQGLSTRNK